jgi:hypothetical protein
MHPHKTILRNAPFFDGHAEFNGSFQALFKLGQRARLLVAALQVRDDTDEPSIFILFDNYRELILFHDHSLLFFPMFINANWYIRTEQFP